MEPAVESIENHKKHYLGQRAFFIFFFRRIKLGIVFGVLAWVSWYGGRWVPAAYQGWSDYATKGLIILFAFDIAFILMQTYFEYRRYSFMFTDEAFIMTHGYVVHNEVAAAYHHIQNVNIQRGMLDRAIGVSQVIILMAGADLDASRRIILPGVGKKKAKLVQKELLVRARRHAIPVYTE